jgi:hypothetical protein
VHPLDGGALSRVGNALTGERARGGAAAVFSWPPWRFTSLSSRCLGLGNRGEESRGRDPHGRAGGLGPGGAAPSPAEAGRGATPPLPVEVAVKGREGERSI